MIKFKEIHFIGATNSDSKEEPRHRNLGRGGISPLRELPAYIKQAGT